MSTTSTAEARLYVADPAPYCSLNVATHFAALTKTEKLYAHHLGRASWHGAPIITEQWSPYAREICGLIASVWSTTSSNKMVDLVEYKKRAISAGVTDQHWLDALEWSAQVLSNLVNYRSFGNSKIIPALPSDAFRKIISASESPNKDGLLSTWDKIADHLYSTSPPEQLLVGKRTDGHISNYYLGDVPTDKEVAQIQSAAEKLGIDTLNTRVKKEAGKFTLLVASSDHKPPTTHTVELGNKDSSIMLNVEYGDFSKELSGVVSELQEAAKYAHNANQQKMIEHYISSFQTGAIPEHIKGSEYWVRDVNPVVESYLGFIESYVDPYGGRAEFEGFTAIVNKELSKKYDVLVNRATELIKVLPWGQSFEVDVFRKPDFTALEILTFATGGIPAGINIPNYYEVREKIGFKNVSLANILAAKAPNQETTFIHPDDLKLYEAWEDKAFEVQVANHELLGHGSGKLFQEDENGKFNFDPEHTIDPLTGQLVTSWYKPGQTWNSVLGEVASSLEECRAETVALYLASNREILQIFSIVEEKDVEDLQYITFLLMARAGLRALEYYDPNAKKHLQAHMQARLGITQFLINAGIARLEEIRDENGVLQNLYVKVDRNKVLEHGRTVVGKLLVELQVRKSTAAGQSANDYYNALTTPPAKWIPEVRDIVVKKKQPRKVFVQPNTFLSKDGEAYLKEYELSPVGAIQSYIERGL